MVSPGSGSVGVSAREGATGSGSVQGMATPPRGKGGGRGKGPRRYIPMRLPEDLADEVIRRADDAGLDINDYVTLVMAQIHGHEIPAYVLSKVEAYRTQLPLGA